MQRQEMIKNCNAENDSVNEIKTSSLIYVRVIFHCMITARKSKQIEMPEIKMSL